MPFRILIVDDSPTVLAVIRIFLMEQNVEFLNADNGQRALAMLESTAINLIISDIHMPVMDGLELTKKIRALPGKIRSVPIVLMTGDADEQMRADGLAAGATAFVKKPVTAAQLREVVGKLIPASKP